MAKPTPKALLILGAADHGNSRFAEVLFNSMAGKMGLRWRASSRGLAVAPFAKHGHPMAPAAVAALESRRVRDAEAVARSPASVSTDDFEQAAMVIALNRAEHQILLQERFPRWADKIEFWDVAESPQAF